MSKTTTTPPKTSRKRKSEKEEFDTFYRSTSASPLKKVKGAVSSTVGRQKERGKLQFVLVVHVVWKPSQFVSAHLAL